jgi:carbamoyltransferase
MLNIIGVSAYFHDSACCLLQDGKITAAAQEERFSRRKHEAGLPRGAFRYCLQSAGLSISDIDSVAYYELPAKKLDRQLWQLGGNISRERCLQLWKRAKRPSAEISEVLGYSGQIEYVEHHLAHAASGFYCSGWEEAAILVVDAVGEWATTSYGHGSREGIDLFEQVDFPHSLGLLYSTITSYLGFGVNDGEYKVMGLAPYGKPTYAAQLREVVQSEPLGQFKLAPKYFDFASGERMYSDLLIEMLKEPPRRKGDPVREFHQDLACSVQRVLEDILLEKLEYLHKRVPVENVCLAGGVALNCTANGRLRRQGPFKSMFIQPAAGDAGGAIGAAKVAHLRRGGSMQQAQLSNACLGPSFQNDEIAALLKSADILATDYRNRERELLSDTADLLIAGKTVGWFQGRMEFGPRALGARSILADPRDPDARDRLNAIVKRREEFRPFAPAVLEEYASQHFDIDHASPFMLETCQVISRLDLPAITHVDGSARVQTVSATESPRFAGLLKAFYDKTACPVLLNTSFNLSDEPIVCSPADALLSFGRSPLDALVMEDFIVQRPMLNQDVISACAAGYTRASTPLERTYTFF